MKTMIAIAFLICLIPQLKAQEISLQDLFLIQQKGQSQSEIYLINNKWRYKEMIDNSKPERYYDYIMKKKVIEKKDSSELNHQVIWEWGNQERSNPIILKIITTLREERTLEYEVTKEIFLKIKESAKATGFIFKDNMIYHQAFSSTYRSNGSEVEFMMEHYTESFNHNPLDERFLYTKYIIRIYPSELSRYYRGGVQKSFKTAIELGR